MSTMEACRDRIRASGLRATPSRIAVLQVLQDAARPLSHADVADALDGSAWNRSTLWRNLTDLEEAGLVRRTELGDRVWRFEERGRGSDVATHAHPHFICTHCGTVSCLPDEVVVLPSAVASAVAPSLPRSLRRRRVEVQIRGLCDTCEG